MWSSRVVNDWPHNEQASVPDALSLRDEASSCSELASVSWASAVAVASLRVRELRISLGISYAVEECDELSSHAP